MDGLELTKSQKKLAHQIIEVGLQREYHKGISQLKQIIGQWNEKAPDHGEVYQAIYKSIRVFDKHIAQRYDDMRGSKYIYVLAGQLADGVITMNDLSVFDEVLKNKIVLLSQW